MRERRMPYTGLGLVFGAGLGLVVGVLLSAADADSGLSLALGLALGAGFGLVVGAVLDARSR